MSTTKRTTLMREGTRPTANADSLSDGTVIVVTVQTTSHKTGKTTTSTTRYEH